MTVRAGLAQSLWNLGYGRDNQERHLGRTVCFREGADRLWAPHIYIFSGQRAVLRRVWSDTFEDVCSRQSGVEIKMNGKFSPSPYMFQGLSVDIIFLYIFRSEQTSGPYSHATEFTPSPLPIPVNIHYHIVLPSTQKLSQLK